MFFNGNILLRVVILVGGFLLLIGGWKALLTAKKEAYDQKSLKVNYTAAIVMLVLGALMAGSILLWIFHQFSPILR